MKLSNTHIQTMEPSRYDYEGPELNLDRKNFELSIKTKQHYNNILSNILCRSTNTTTSTDVQSGCRFAMVRTNTIHLDRLYEFESDLYEIMKHTIKHNDPHWENNNQQNMKASILYPLTDERIYIERNGEQCKYLSFYIDKNSKNNISVKMNLYIEVNEHYMLTHSDLSDPILYTRKHDSFYKLILDSHEMFNLRANYFCLNPLLKNRNRNEFFIESGSYVIEVTYDNKQIKTTLEENKKRSTVFEIVEKYINEHYSSFNVQLRMGYKLAKVNNNNYTLLLGNNPVQLSFHKDGYKLLIQDDVCRLVVDDWEDNCDHRDLTQDGEKLIKVVTTDQIESYRELNNEQFSILNHIYVVYVGIYASLNEITKKIDEFDHYQRALKLNVKPNGVLTVENRFSQLPSDWFCVEADSWYSKLPLISGEYVDATKLNEFFKFHEHLFNNKLLVYLDKILLVFENDYYEFVSGNDNTDLESMDLDKIKKKILDDSLIPNSDCEQVNKLHKIFIQFASKVGFPMSKVSYCNNSKDRLSISVWEMKNKIQNPGHYYGLLLDFKAYMEQVMCLKVFFLYVDVENAFRDNIHNELINKYVDYIFSTGVQQYIYIGEISLLLESISGSLKVMSAHIEQKTPEIICEYKKTGKYETAVDLFKKNHYNTFIKCLMMIDNKDNKYCYVHYVNLESHYEKEIKNASDINKKILLSKEYIDALHQEIIKDLYKYIRDKRELFTKNFLETSQQ